MHHHRGVGAFYIEQALDPQNLRAVGVQQQRQPDAKHRPIDRFGQIQRKGHDVAVHIGVGALCSGRSERQVVALVGRLQPLSYFVALAGHVKRIHAQQVAGVKLHRVQRQAWRTRVHLGELRIKRRGLRCIGNIQLGNHQPVGHSHLFLAFGVLAQIGSAINRVHRSHHIAHAKVVLQHPVVHHGGQHRHRVGQASGLDHQAHKGGYFATLAPVIQDAYGGGQVAADGAANAARLQQHHVAVHPVHQVVVDADVAKFVDEHRAVVKQRVTQQAVEQAGFSRTQKAGQHVDRNAPGHTAASAGCASGSKLRPVISCAACQIWGRLSTTICLPVGPATKYRRPCQSLTVTRSGSSARLITRMRRARSARRVGALAPWMRPAPLLQCSSPPREPQTPHMRYF